MVETVANQETLRLSREHGSLREPQSWRRDTLTLRFTSS